MQALIECIRASGHCKRYKKRRLKGERTKYGKVSRVSGEVYKVLLKVSEADNEVGSSTRDLSNVPLLEESGNVHVVEPMPLSRSTPIKRKQMVPCKKNPLVDDTKLQPVMVGSSASNLFVLHKKFLDTNLPAGRFDELL